jgi:DNA-binding LacI/PurR family transcriptional regulator
LKTRAAVELLRRKIIRGVWTPGQRLPGRRDLCTELRVSLTTVQEALRELIETGYAEARSTSGTFVTALPPHLHLFGLVLPEDTATNRFHAALHGEAVRLLKTPEQRLRVWTHVAPPLDSPPLRDLLAGVDAQSFAGLIFPQIGYALAQSPIVQAPGVPRVVFASDKNNDGLNHVAKLNLDYDTFVEQSIRALLAHGRRRVALIHHAGQSPEPFLRAMQGRLPAPPVRWVQSASLQTPQSARNLAHLLFHREQKSRPDAIWITDDNLVEPATAGMLDAGVRVPRDVRVVAHCNFPWLTESHVPASRVGFDATEAINACLDLLRLQREALLAHPSRELKPMTRRIAARSDGE